MKRVAVFGGTFNPVHNGHLIIASMVYEKLNLDKLIFIPARIPPHKEYNPQVDDKVRLEFIQRAIKDNPMFDVTDLEFKRDGASYSLFTINTLLEQGIGSDELYYIIGADLVSGLDTWYKINELEKLVTFIAVNRTGGSVSSSGIPVKFLEFPRIDISSTLIRQRLAEGKSVRYLLPESVEELIYKNGYYIDNK
ncbi:MAG: nicotinate-nucleotide adenylyltransferase [Spirochaetes bacterium]|nr:nicotinate-nucleotide adenylyltransferase [Spirochaetota bacterium]MCK5268615.1 nicotinate-nucleotide adenylyltransferase [Spirochaetota bacterium]